MCFSDVDATRRICRGACEEKKRCAPTDDIVLAIRETVNVRMKYFTWFLRLTNADDDVPNHLLQQLHLPNLSYFTHYHPAWGQHFLGRVKNKINKKNLYHLAQCTREYFVCIYCIQTLCRIINEVTCGRCRLLTPISGRTRGRYYSIY